MNTEEKSIMTVYDWENTYKTKGIVQDKILQTVKQSVQVMLKNRCKKVLDLGCGTGRHTLYLAQNNFDVYGIDKSQTAIDITGQRALELNLNVTLKQSDLKKINFENDFFDAVLCVWTTGHGLKKDVKKSVSEMYRVLKPNGLLFVDFMSTKDLNYGKGIALEEATFLHDFLDHSDVPHHYSSYTELQEFFKIFKEKKISPITYDDPKYHTTINAFWVEAIK